MLIYIFFVFIIKAALIMVTIKQHSSLCKENHCQYSIIISNIYNDNIKILSTKIYKNTKIEVFILNNRLNIKENYVLCNIHFNLLTLYLHFKELKIKQLPIGNYKLFYDINYDQINIEICKLKNKLHIDHPTFIKDCSIDIYKLLMDDIYTEQITQLLINHVKLYCIKFNNKKYIIGEKDNKIIFVNEDGIQENIIFTYLNRSYNLNPKLELQPTINQEILKSKEIKYLKHIIFNHLLENKVYLNPEYRSFIIISDEFKIIITILILFIIFFYLTLRFYNIILLNRSLYVYRRINNYIFEIYRQIVNWNINKL